MEKILIFGGTFDPVHHGHLITARCAMDELGISRTLLLPAWCSPHKQMGASSAAEHRLAMLRLAVEGDGSFAIETWELEQGRGSYSYDTAQALQMRWPDKKLCWMMGADQIPKLHTWYRIADFLRLVDPIILARPGQDRASLLALASELGSELAERVSAGWLANPLVEISATQMRRRAAQGLSLRYFVPASVASYIQEHKLYQV